MVFIFLLPAVLGNPMSRMTPELRHEKNVNDMTRCGSYRIALNIDIESIPVISSIYFIYYYCCVPHAKHIHPLVVLIYSLF